MSLSPALLALRSIDVPNKQRKQFRGKVWPALENAEDAYRRSMRGDRMLRDWLKAGDQDAELDRLADIWGITRGRVQTEIDKRLADPSIVNVEMAAQIDVYRQQRKREIVANGDRLRLELEAQITSLEKKRADGTKWVEIEQIGDKDIEGGWKTKRRAINTLLRDLKAELLTALESEGETMAQYVPKPAIEHKHSGAVLHIEATEEFKRELERVSELDSPQDAEFEEVSE